MNDDLKTLFRKNYLQYASYVILDRAIPEIIDGLKPVQRRILWTLHQMDDNKFHKVANAAGQTMALHPHGDAPIVDALVNLANKNYLLEKQGNFGNPFTGDPAAAARYIETRLAALAKETLFNEDLTAFAPSYDGRQQEPLYLPAKIPLLLMQGAEGIAVGMATRILPHNFAELLTAQIAYLEKKPFEILPDFPSGGSMDAASYEGGKGPVRHRATLEIRDDKTIVITQIAYGTTTESVIRSIDEAAKRGKIKIDSINDYTAEKVEIEIKLPRGQWAKESLDPLYAFTECEVTLHSQVVVIKDKLPWEGTVDEILIYQTEKLVTFLQQELVIEQNRLQEKIFGKILERIFIENRLYKQIENIASLEKIDVTLERSLEPFLIDLARLPTKEDRSHLLELPIRKISRFDIEKNSQEIEALQKSLKTCQKHLKNVRLYTLGFLKELYKKHADQFERKTKIDSFAKLEMATLQRAQKFKVGFDEEKLTLGSRVSGKLTMECTPKDRLLILYSDGTYKVIAIPERSFIGGATAKPVWIGLADKTTHFCVLYSTAEGVFAKRFVVKQFILNKIYRFFDEGCKLMFITERENPKLKLYFKKMKKQKIASRILDFQTVLEKSVTARGIRIEKTVPDRIENMEENQ